MAAPTHPVTAGLQVILDHLQPMRSGEVAQYIPELASAEPDHFGIALVSMAGHRYSVGDAHLPFTMQSISKAFVLALAMTDLGVDGVLDRVGVEPSGEAYNAISLDEAGRPANPMVNAGALVTTSLVRAQYPEERFERILTCLSRFAGRPLEVDDAVFASELATASRNRALAYLMESAGSLTEPVEEVLEVYCRQCAVAVTATDVAVMAATLAAGGVNPVTGEAVVSETIATQTLAVMATCGMYDFSGEWLMRVGLPAKSGVAGGLIAASPAEFGIGVFSPRLDERGNSVRGMAVARELAARFDLHLMHHPGETAPVVYERGRTDVSGNARDVVWGQTGSIVLVAAQGVIEFAAAEQFVAAIHQDAHSVSQAPRGVVVDLHRVTRLGDIAEGLLTSSLAKLISEEIAVALVQPEHLQVSVAPSPRFRVFRDRAQALEWLDATP